MSRSPLVNIRASLYVRKCVPLANSKGLPKRQSRRSKNSFLSLTNCRISGSFSGSTFSYISFSCK